MLGKPIDGRMFFEADSGTTSGGATESTEGAPGKDSTSDANVGGQSDGKATEFQPITSQEDFDAALAARLARHEAKVRKSITDQVTAQIADDAKSAKAKEANDYKALYEAETQRRELAERERDQERKTTLRNRIAAKHKLPDELADVLKGDSEDELDEHAKRLAKVVKTRQAPDTEVGTGGTTNSGGPSDRPKPKAPANTDQTAQPVYTFDGKVKIPFPTAR